eukprot:scaffold687156_cov145-Attheya_sp.AAC.1
MQDHPKPTDAHFITLAKLYKQKSNGTTIFPKLPSMRHCNYESSYLREVRAQKKFTLPKLSRQSKMPC